MFIELVMLSNFLILCRPLILLPSVLPCIKVFSNGWLFASHDQSIGAPDWAPAFPMYSQGWFHLRWTGLISLLSSSVSFSLSVVSNFLWPPGKQQNRLSCPSPSPGTCSNSCPLSQWCHLTISSLLSHSLPVFNLSQHQGLFQWVSSFHKMAKVLQSQLQHQTFQGIFRTDFL